jgi:hypothetical protein
MESVVLWMRNGKEKLRTSERRLRCVFVFMHLSTPDAYNGVHCELWSRYQLQPAQRIELFL